MRGQNLLMKMFSRPTASLRGQAPRAMGANLPPGLAEPATRQPRRAAVTAV